MTQSPKPRNDEWGACPPGELSRMVDARREKTRRKNLDRMALATALVLLVVTAAGVNWAINGNSSLRGHHGGLRCSEVNALLPKYVQKTTSVQTASQIEGHLAHCKKCRDKLEEMRSQTAQITPTLTMSSRRSTHAFVGGQLHPVVTIRSNP